jgi:type IV pilus assembly protein PilV
MNAHASHPRIPGSCGQTMRRVGGFTLIEVLVTAAVTMVAFTGLATLQVLALRAADSTLERAQATALAYDVIDRLRLNRGSAGIALTALGGGYDGATLCDSTSRHAHDPRTCSFDALTDLTAGDRVTLDLRQWWQTLEGSKLANWYAGVQRTGDMFLVSVQWDDSRAENLAPSATALRTSCLGGQMPNAMQEICVMTQL